MIKWSDAAIRVTEWLVVATVILVLCVFVAEASESDQMYADGFECRVDCPPPVEPVNWSQCTQGDPDTDPLSEIQPFGFLQVNRTWVQAFSATGAFKRPPKGPIATYPNSPGSPVAVTCRPLTSTTNACTPDKGTYTVVPFTPPAGLTVNLSWDPVQANPAYGYSLPRPADSIFVGISNCPGDLRAPDALSQIPMLQNGCRRIGSGATLAYSTLPGQSSEFVCRLSPGQTYYINLSAVDPTDGLEIGEHTCSTSALNSIGGCDAQHRHTGFASRSEKDAMAWLTERRLEDEKRRAWRPVLNQIGDILGRDWSKR